MNNTKNVLHESNLILCFNSQTPAGIYLFKVNNRNTRTRCEISSKVTISFFIVNFEHILQLVLVFAFLTLNSKMPARICYCSLKVSRKAPWSFTNHNSMFWSRMFQNNRNNRTRCEISSELTISVLILNFEYLSHLVQVFALLTLKGEILARLLLLQSQGEQNNKNHNSVLQCSLGCFRTIETLEHGVKYLQS